MDQTVLRAIDDAVIAGAVLIVARDGAVAYELAAGVRDPWVLPAPPMTTDTIFDTASLAKPIATATAAAFAAREGRIDPVALVQDHWSLDDLLLHRADMPEYIDWKRIADFVDDRSTREALLMAIGDVKPTGRSRYSNAGYLLAGLLIEESVNASLTAYLSTHAWQPFDMHDTGFRLSDEQRTRVASAANDLAPGQPFDPLADYWLKAIERDPGHSGLFSTAQDIAAWSIAMMRALNDESDPLHDVAQFVIGDAFEMHDEQDRRVVRTRGFLIREDDALFGPMLEHTGFTGCALWLDPRREIAIVLLTCGSDGQSPRWRRMGNDILRSVRIGARHGG